MKKEIVKSEIILIGAALFNLIFWHEKMGINTVLFTLFMVSSLWYIERDSFQTRAVRITVAVSILLSALVVWHNSLIVKIIYMLNFSIMIGMIQQRQLRFLGNAFLLYWISLFAVPKNLILSLKQHPILRGHKKMNQGLKLAAIPAIVFPIFYGIYYAANPKFAELAGQFWGKVLQWLSFDWNGARIAFFLLGLMVVGAAFWASRYTGLLHFENGKTDALNAEDFEEREFTFWDFSVENAYRSTLILMVSLNVLLLFNNLLDFNYVWLGGAGVRSAVELKQYVHEGTYILIVGILLALVVLQIMYKGTLNFKENSQILRGLSFAWLGQNAVLAVSVGMRNWQYIDYYGLAYKRVGVFIFLSLVLYGLWLMYLKINEKRTFFFFISRGAWAIYGVMVATCFINWDVFITRYNLTVTTKSGAVDVPFLTNIISDKNLYLLDENKEKLLQKMPNKPFESEEYWRSDALYFTNETDKKNYLERTLKQKRDGFDSEQKSLTWLSWNYADYANSK